MFGGLAKEKERGGCTELYRVAGMLKARFANMTREGITAYPIKLLRSKNNVYDNTDNFNDILKYCRFSYAFQ